VSRWQALGTEMSDAMMANEAPSPRVLRTWAARAGRTRIRSLLRIADAVWCAERGAGRPAPLPARVRGTYRALLRIAYRDPIEIADLAVDGEDLASSGIPPGPQVGKILRALLEIVLDDPARNTRQELVAAARVVARRSDSKE
jgi:hypothetical protein